CCHPSRVRTNFLQWWNDFLCNAYIICNDIRTVSRICTSILDCDCIHRYRRVDVNPKYVRITSSSCFLAIHSEVGERLKTKTSLLGQRWNACEKTSGLECRYCWYSPLGRNRECSIYPILIQPTGVIPRRYVFS